VPTAAAEHRDTIVLRAACGGQTRFRTGEGAKDLCRLRPLGVKSSYSENT